MTADEIEVTMADGPCEGKTMLIPRDLWLYGSLRLLIPAYCREWETQTAIYQRRSFLTNKLYFYGYLETARAAIRLP